MSIAPNSIINGDCLEVMKDIDDRSIDCIICDPMASQPVNGM
jgi:predicted methyltransferase